MNKSKMIPVLTLIGTFGFLGVIFYLLRFGMPQPESQALGQLIGTLNALVGAAWGYYIGTTHSSGKKDEAKDDIIAKLLPGDGKSAAP